MTTPWFVPPHQTQRTGSRCQFSDCWCAVGAWLHRAATGGTAAVTPSEFRELAGGGSGRPNPSTGCRAGVEDDVRLGLDALGVKARTIKVPVARAKALLSTVRRPVFAIATDYDAWPTIGDLDCMTGVPGPDVNHEVGLIPGVDGQGRIKVMNPLCDAYQLVKLDKVLKAAAKYSANQGRAGVWLTRVLRPLPAGTPADQVRIAELEAQVVDLEDTIAEARAHATATVEALA